MTDIQQLKCENCGAPLKEDLTCPYCGARYERKGAGINTCDEQTMCLSEEESAEYVIETLVISDFESKTDRIIECLHR